MASTRLLRPLALVTLTATLALSLAWLAGPWYPTGNDEITHLQNAHNVALAVRDAPIHGAWEAWMGRYPGEERGAYWPGFVYLLTVPASLMGALRAPLVGLLLSLAGLLLAVFLGARSLAGQSQGSAPGWRALMLCLLPSVVLLEFCYQVERVQQASEGARLTWLGKAATAELPEPARSTPAGGACPADIALVASGPYRFQSPSDAPLNQAWEPPRTAHVASFCIDLYEYPNSPPTGASTLSRRGPRRSRLSARAAAPG